MRRAAGWLSLLLTLLVVGPLRAQTEGGGEALPATEAPAPPAEPASVDGIGAGETTVEATPVESAEGSGAAADEEKTFDLKVKGLEERVTDLKERIYRTKARLLLLQETVISDNLTSGAKAVLIHRNEMGASFVVESVTYALDGAPIYTKVDTGGELDRQEEIEIFNGRIVPGNHQITARVVLRGSGFGVFSYLEGYKFTVQSSYTFNAEGGKTTQLKIVSYEKGGITTDLKDRPAIKYDETTSKDQPKRKLRGGKSKDEGTEK
ncbi:MAG: dihydrolipoamide acetyltransferase [Deltaproteobacteria bacterium]|nr:dihydrolipoamide acetyltransferase [Deltaproteobacteria bacterium]